MTDETKQKRKKYGETSSEALISACENALTAGIALKRWWEHIEEVNGYKHPFQLVRTFSQSHKSFGFFDSAIIGTRSVSIMGVVEDREFDFPKSDESHRFREELREFVLRYLMRVSDFRRPTVFISTDSNAQTPNLFRSLSWCPNDEGGLVGFGFGQHWYKLNRTDEILSFPPEERYEIVDLREFCRSYEWIIAKVRIFDFSVRLSSPLNK